MTNATATKTQKIQKYFVVGATPTVEFKIEAIDAGKLKSELVVGFKRYDSSQVKLVRKQFQEMIKETQDLDERKADKFERYEMVNGVKTGVGEIIEKGEDIPESLIDSARERYALQVNNFIRENVIYIKGIKIQDAAGQEVFKIPDTRTYTDVRITDEGYDNTLDFALDLYLGWDIWIQPLLLGVFSALNNAPKEEKGKN